MFKLPQLLLRCSRNGNKVPKLTRINSSSSASAIAEAKSTHISEVNDQRSSKKPQSFQKGGSMVSAAFASLQFETADSEIRTPVTDDKISKATTVNELLSISTGNGVSRRHAFKVVSVLADWSSEGKVSMLDFESDPRFIRLCRILTKNSYQKFRNPTASKSEDLSTILSVTADDEAAKLVGSITLPQMVKVISTLCQKKRRSTLLLRSLSYNITASSEKLDLKQCADVLYSITMLNFPDENLLGKLSSDICDGLKSDLKKSSVVGSIITSLGLLRYKNAELLDVLSEWIHQNHSICRPQDLFSFFMTLAVLNYTPSNAEKLYQDVLPQLTPTEAGKPLSWLEVVWSLVLLNQATQDHVSSILCDSFIEKLVGSKALSPSTKLKIMNIDAAATYLMNNYSGSRITDKGNVQNVQIVRSKEKIEMVEVLGESLRSLIQSDKLATNVNTGAGFYIDVKFVLDRKCNPLPITAENKADAIKVAVVTHDYHDMCRHKIEPTGFNVFAKNILEKMGYKTIIIPYTEFHLRDKVVHRVQYLEGKLKEIAQS